MDCVYPPLQQHKNPRTNRSTKSRIGHNYYVPCCDYLGSAWGTTKSHIWYHTAVHTNEDGKIVPEFCFTVGQLVDVDKSQVKCPVSPRSLGPVPHVVLAVGMCQPDNASCPRNKDCLVLLGPSSILQSEASLHEDVEIIINIDELVRSDKDSKKESLPRFRFECVTKDKLEVVTRLFHIIMNRKRGILLVSEAHMRKTIQKIEQGHKSVQANVGYLQSELENKTKLAEKYHGQLQETKVKLRKAQKSSPNPSVPTKLSREQQNENQRKILALTEENGKLKGENVTLKSEIERYRNDNKDAFKAMTATIATVSQSAEEEKERGFRLAEKSMDVMARVTRNSSKNSRRTLDEYEL